MTARGSFVVDVVRGEVVESSHVVHAVVADRHGTLQTWGDGRRPTIARSAIKSVQALPLVTTGAADAFEVSETELALACSSHSAEPAHVDAVAAWLDRIGLSEDDLECGPDSPIGPELHPDYVASGLVKEPRYNGCSGKHAGFLTVLRHVGADTAGYIHRCSPIQQMVTAATETLTGVELGAQQPGIDGCGIPVFAVPLENLAFAMARLVDPVDLPDDVAAAAPRVVAAARRSFWVAGTGRTEHGIEQVATEPVVVKAGAEGVFMGALPERGLGVAVKSADGTARASHTAVRTLLAELGAIPAFEPEEVVNKAGARTGERRAVFSAPAEATLER
ncbi:MAG: asparaginase [Actinomycetota bacterium]